MDLINIILLGCACGLVGAFAMNLFMRKVSSAYSKRVDMLVALGCYFTGTVDNASVE